MIEIGATFAENLNIETLTSHNQEYNGETTIRGEKMSKRKGKIVYLPPEKCYTNVYIEITAHGYKIYRKGMERPFTVIPHSAVKEVLYDREDER